jgi:signal transduction histidine kinase
MKLTAKLVLVLFVAITLLLGLDGYFSFQREVELIRSKQELTVKLFARTLQLAWRQSGDQRVFDWIDELNAPHSAVRVRWVWLDRLPSDPAQPRPLPSDLASILRGQVVSRRQPEKDGKACLFTYARVTLAAQRPGGIELREPLPSTIQYVRQFIVRLGTMTVLMALVGGVLIFFLGTEMVGRPLQLLIEKTRRVARGDLAGPLHLRGHDELTELADALNAMCDQLAASQQQVRQEETARAAAMDQLRHADRLRTVGGMASGMAHELGTPLAVVSGRAELIASGKLSPEEITHSAQTIKAESQRMATIIRQLLDFARRSAPRTHCVDLRQIASQTVELLQALARKHNVALNLNGQAEPAMTTVDAGQIQQVLTNLIVNAVQSMPHGGRVHVGIQRQQAVAPPGRRTEPGDYFCIQVQDEGGGIPEPHLEHVFEPFFTTKDVGEGTGLGLSVSYGIVQEHGGWIDVQSRVGAGSCFSVFLPIRNTA